MYVYRVQNTSILIRNNLIISSKRSVKTLSLYRNLIILPSKPIGRGTK